MTDQLVLACAKGCYLPSLTFHVGFRARARYTHERSPRKSYSLFNNVPNVTKKITRFRGLQSLADMACLSKAGTGIRFSRRELF